MSETLESTFPALASCCRRAGRPLLLLGGGLLLAGLGLLLSGLLWIDMLLCDGGATLLGLALLFAGAWRLWRGARLVFAEQNPALRALVRSPAVEGWLYLHRPFRGRGPSLHLGVAGHRPLVIRGAAEQLEPAASAVTGQRPGVRPLSWNAGLLIAETEQAAKRHRLAMIMTLLMAAGLWIFARIEPHDGSAVLLYFFAAVFALPGVMVLQLIFRSENPLAGTAARVLVESPEEVVGLELRQQALRVRTTAGQRHSIGMKNPQQLLQELRAIYPDIQTEWNSVLAARYRENPQSVRPSVIRQKVPQAPPATSEAGLKVRRFRLLRAREWWGYLLALILLVGPVLWPQEGLFWLGLLQAPAYAGASWRRNRLTPRWIALHEGGLRLPGNTFVPWHGVQSVSAFGSRWKIHVSLGRPLVVSRGALIHAIVQRAGLQWHDTHNLLALRPGALADPLLLLRPGVLADPER